MFKLLFHREPVERPPIPGQELIMTKFPNKYSNTSPLGLIGFGFTTIMLSFANVTLFDLNSMIIGLGLFYGGMTQFVAGVYELKKGNTFSGTAFCSYGAFWLSFCLMATGSPILGVEPPDYKAEGIFLLFWAVFTGFMFIGTLKHGHITLKLILLTLTFTFLILAIGAFAKSKTVTKVGGGFGFLCGGIAFYTAVAEVIDGEQGYTFMPI